MTTTIDGIYENGKITLNELPKNIEKAQVKVVFEETKQKVEPGKRKMGIFRGTITMSDDFDETMTELEEFWT
ncbi:DUF2281 domain-containing protein [Lacihabitans soyangensis]|uniref:DUF2281 domain-containing protein n=1 Tax=Lacihabitans soyangensis TaxID=869394 RepID=A0AAE3H2G9_9BACT|nr:DUF2281 domain-containing protein [Lacihabitans soyangensis]MCP9761640.1 hypothetical protein [Lacihabitans soyangensis]